MKHSIILGGPTAVGKSDIAVEIALANNGEVVSADSRQVYTGLDIGSGKVTKEEMCGVPHHMLDIVSPKKIYTAYQFSQDAYTAIASIHARNRLPIIIGGTGFYIHALRYSNVISPKKINEEKRKALESMNRTVLTNFFIKTYGEKTASHIDMKNKEKIIRAIEREGEVIRETNYTPRFPHLYVVFFPPKEKIMENIKIRLEKRWDGMVEEIENLLKNGLSEKRMYQLGLEYRFISQIMLGTYTEKEGRDLLYTAICQYAKRQGTWFKKYGGIIFEEKEALLTYVNDYCKKL